MHPKAKSGIFWLSCERYTVGLIVQDTIIKHAPPIARWMIGKTRREIYEWATKKEGFKMEWWDDVLELEEEEQ